MPFDESSAQNYSVITLKGEREKKKLDDNRTSLVNFDGKIVTSLHRRYLFTNSCLRVKNQNFLEGVKPVPFMSEVTPKSFLFLSTGRHFTLKGLAYS